MESLDIFCLILYINKMTVPGNRLHYYLNILVDEKLKIFTLTIPVSNKTNAFSKF